MYLHVISALFNEAFLRLAKNLKTSLFWLQRAYSLAENLDVMVRLPRNVKKADRWTKGSRASRGLKAHWPSNLIMHLGQPIPCKGVYFYMCALGSKTLPMVGGDFILLPCDLSSQ